MLFNSYEFIFLFLPLTVLVYYLINGLRRYEAAKLWLVAASLVFYTWWNTIYIFVIIISILLNYAFGQVIIRERDPGKAKRFVWLGCGANLALLCYYKYTDFFIGNINLAFEANIPLLHLALPLAISFFTFQQIAFLVDCYRGEVKSFSLPQYFLFVSLFCQLIAGPIVNQREIFPQFDNPARKKIDYANISTGLFLFFCGLLKKVALADTLSGLADAGFGAYANLGFVDAWMVSLSYTMQLYFDFSGYVDMATGAALMLNIRLPVNFFSPYKSLNITDFWRRWHITLGRFLRDYLYIPLGGNRRSTGRTFVNVMITFMLGGLWHGAGWLFLIWGALHGLALVVHRLWTRTGIKLHPFLAGALTFLFVNTAWVFFRAPTLKVALRVLKSMYLPDFQHPFAIQNPAGFDFKLHLAVLAIASFIAFLLPNTNELAERFKPRWAYAVFITAAFALGFALLEKQSPFLYWQF